MASPIIIQQTAANPRRRMIGRIALGVVGLGLLVIAINKLRQNAALKKAADDPNASLAIQLHLVLRPKMGAMSLLSAIGVPSITDSVTALFDSTNSPQARALVIAGKIQNYPEVSKFYQKLFGKSLEKDLINRLGEDGFDSFTTAIRAKADNPYAAPSNSGNTILGAKDGNVFTTKPGATSGAVLVALQETFPLPTPKDYYRAQLVTHYGNVDLPDFQRGQVVGYPTGKVEKDKAGNIYVQVGNASFSPKRTWWIRRAQVNSYPDHTAAQKDWPTQLSYSNPFLKQ